MTVEKMPPERLAYVAEWAEFYLGGVPQKEIAALYGLRNPATVSHSIAEFILKFHPSPTMQYRSLVSSSTIRKAELAVAYARFRADSSLQQATAAQARVQQATAAVSLDGGADDGAKAGRTPAKAPEWDNAAPAEDAAALDALKLPMRVAALEERAKDLAAQLRQLRTVVRKLGDAGLDGGGLQYRDDCDGAIGRAEFNKAIFDLNRRFEIDAADLKRMCGAVIAATAGCDPERLRRWITSGGFLVESPPS